MFPDKNNSFSKEPFHNVVGVTDSNKIAWLVHVHDFCKMPIFLGKLSFDIQCSVFNCNKVT